MAPKKAHLDGGGVGAGEDGLHEGARGARGKVGHDASWALVCNIDVAGAARHNDACMMRIEKLGK